MSSLGKSSAGRSGGGGDRVAAEDAEEYDDPGDE